MEKPLTNVTTEDSNERSLVRGVTDVEIGRLRFLLWSVIEGWILMWGSFTWKHDGIFFFFFKGKKDGLSANPSGFPRNFSDFNF